MVYNRALDQTFQRKFKWRWDGPYIIHKKFTNGVYFVDVYGWNIDERKNEGCETEAIYFMHNELLSVNDFLRDEEWNFCLYIFLKFLKIFSVQEKDRMQIENGCIFSKFRQKALTSPKLVWRGLKSYVVNTYVA